MRNYVLVLEESGCSPAVADIVKEISQFLTELSVGEYYFTTCKPSLTGVATVLIAIERFDEYLLPFHVRSEFLEHIHSMEILDRSLHDVLKYMRRISEYNLPAIETI